MLRKEKGSSGAGCALWVGSGALCDPALGPVLLLRLAVLGPHCSSLSTCSEQSRLGTQGFRCFWVALALVLASAGSTQPSCLSCSGGHCASRPHPPWFPMASAAAWH